MKKAANQPRWTEETMGQTPAFDNPKYWRDRARDERAFAQHKRTSRIGTVESIQVHEQNAKDYEARADLLERGAA